ncbi:hypothetical protein FEE96_22375 [Parasedimentitalea maritima]|uniref:CobW/HypB/UreG nucleotide-binding domain-containing protein n=1 Tax=Parasedimentitalea maritima TaxID=2578117 RepID=A0ABY2UNI3_9RHOB|nr:GTP-binding protein [Zongyanglinia marina]TLP55472.1 hypothetical protein FEE96_22375 [Zongyanglinia marina]
MTTIPFTLIAGYLGAGKTTFLNRILAQTQGTRYAVIVNDFGAVNIDETLIISRSATKLALANGCVCCTMGQSLSGLLAELLANNPQPDHIVMEASGVADPARLSWLGLAAGLHYTGIYTLADLSLVSKKINDKYFGRLVESQLMHANVILTTKPDLCKDVGEVERFLRQRFDGEVMSVDRFTKLEKSHSTTAQLQDKTTPPVMGFSHDIWRSKQRFTKQEVDLFAQSMAKSYERTKGYVLGSDPGVLAYLVQTTGPNWTVSEAKTYTKIEGIMVQITAPGSTLVSVDIQEEDAECIQRQI